MRTTMVPPLLRGPIEWVNVPERDENHRYSLQGRELPSVSSVLEVLAGPEVERFLRTVPNGAAIFADAAAYGTAFHAWATAYLIGQVGPEALPRLFADALCSIRSWLQDHGMTIIALEQKLAVPQWEVPYAGEFDLLVTLPNGDPLLLDFKTSSALRKTYRLQLAAYAHLLRYQPHIPTEWDYTRPIRRGILHAPRNKPGAVSYVDYTATADEDDRGWLHLLGTWAWSRAA